MRRFLALLSIAGLLPAGCMVDVTLDPNKPIACGIAGECPQGRVCVDGYCVSPPVEDGGPQHQPPVAVADSYRVDEGNSLTVPAAGVLANDTDPESLPLTAKRVSGPDHGSLGLNPDGSFVYVPNAGFKGSDTFTYRANNGYVDSEPVSVEISVVTQNHPPTAHDDNFATPVDTELSLSAPGVLANDFDADAQVLTATLDTDATHGLLALDPSGAFTYTPDPGYIGSDTFRYHASDGVEDSAVATVTIIVGGTNTQPLAADDAYEATAGVPLSVPAETGVLANDSDAELDPLHVLLVAPPSHGTVDLAPDGSFVYTAAVTYAGEDTFTYQANDGLADSRVATVRVTVIGVNQPPTANPDGYSTPLDQPLIVGAPGVLGNDTDPENQALSAALVAQATHGQVILAADGSFTYAPEPGYIGPDSFTYQASDGELPSATTTVSITVGGTNHAPVAEPDAYNASATVALVVPAPGVLANDSDVDGQTPRALLVQAAAHGTIGLNQDGSFVYSPNPTFAGTDSFTYQANDGLVDSNVVTVTLTVNGAPVTKDDVAVVANGDTVILDVLANDTDPESEPLAVTNATATQGTVSVLPDNTLSFTAPATFTNASTITYTVNDTALPPNTSTGRAIVVKRPSFGGPTTYGVGSAPVAVAIGDLNKDGRQDLAVANSGSANVTVLLQQAVDGGTTTFNATNYAAGTGPSAVGIGQLIGSPNTPNDVVVANAGAGTITIRDGSNLGGTPQTHDGGVSPSCIAVGAISNGSREDIAIGNAIAAPDNVRTLFFSSSYNTPTLRSAGTNPSAIALANLDGNLILDLVIANQGSNDVTVVLQSSATGAPTSVTNYAVGVSPSGVALGDLNGDGKVDIVVANYVSGTVSVLLQTSGGAFASAVDFAAGPNPSSVAVGQLNGDTVPDIVVTNQVGVTTDNVSVLANATPAGSMQPLFAPPVTFSSNGLAPTAVVVGLLSGDTKPDLAVVNRDSDNLCILTGAN